MKHFIFILFFAGTIAATAVTNTNVIAALDIHPGDKIIETRDGWLITAPDGTSRRVTRIRDGLLIKRGDKSIILRKTRTGYIAQETAPINTGLGDAFEQARRNRNKQRQKPDN
jgi:hypothetical protein